MQFTRLAFGVDNTIEALAPGVTMKHTRDALRGPKLLPLKNATLSCIADALNSTAGDGLDVPDLYLWIRELLTVATSDGVYGNDNPIRKNPSLIDALW